MDAVEHIEGILENIILRLPVESIISCKAVSRNWYGLISRPEFLKLQLSWSKSDLIYLIFPRDEDSDIVTEVHLMEDFVATSEIMLPGFENLCSPRVICSVNGLICCTIDVSPSALIHYEIRICNPITREVLVLPKGCPSAKDPSVGLAFNGDNSEYKIYHFFYDPCDNHCECEIYSSETGSWRGIGTVSEFPMVNLCSPNSADHIFVSGKLYWLMSSKEDTETPVSILSVSYNEQFSTINLPYEVTAWSFLIDLEGSLSLVCVDETEIGVDIWVLEDHETSRWSLQGSGELDLENLAYFDSVVAIKREVFFIIRDLFHTSHYRVYDLDLQAWRTLTFPRYEGYSPVAFPFVKSLLPCKYQV
ncbi:hypothetical protein RJ640_004621 [Escallonia rubra]|uniref:F-box domain-containing protein n=1 Tax=Escallonia rubra TaxID=112253 RepID=A0AA88UJW1_9ASTE|nr:hypothetical protein RJ640_004621 [Escallonia rubra]